MADCRQCADFEWCAEHEDCGLFKPKQKQTNADRIRAMTDDELAEVLCKARTSCGLVMGDKDCVASCMVCWLDWLKQEVTTNSTT